MADRTLFISWDHVVRGREEYALELFNESVGYYGRLQQAGRIERFDVNLITPSGAGTQGFFLLYGTAEQIYGVREDREFQAILTRANMCIEGLCVATGLTGQGIADQMALYQETIAALPAMA